MHPILAFADSASLGTSALAALAALFAYLSGRDRLRFDAKVVLLEKTVSDNAADMADATKRMTALESDYEECKNDRRELRDKVEAMEEREAARHGAPEPSPHSSS